MALLAKAGTFITPGSGTTTVTGLGFRPATILLWTENATGDNAWSTGLDEAIGFWSRPRPALAVRSQSAWVSMTTASTASTAAAAGLDPSRPLTNRAWNLTSIAEGVDNSSFVVTYGTRPANNTRVHWLALSADALSQILTFQLNPALHNTIGQQIQVRGAGFTPNAVLAISQLTATSAGKTLGFGAADDTLGQWAMNGSASAQAAPTNTDRVWREGSVVAVVSTTGAIICEAMVVAMRPDGFDLALLTPPTAIVDCYFLCIGNVNAKAVVAAKPTGAAPAAQTLVAPFAPRAAVFGSTFQTAVGPAAHQRGTIGASAGGVQASGAWTNTDAVASSQANGISRIDVSVLKADAPTTVQAASAATLTATGASLSWNPNDAVASRFGALFLGNLTHVLGGDVFVETASDTAEFRMWQLLLGSSVNVATLAETTTLWRVSILGGDVLVNTLAESRVSLKHRLGGIALSDTLVDSFLRLHARLAGIVAVETDVSGHIWIPIRLASDVVIETASEGKVALRHTLRASQVVVETAAEAYFTLVLPIIPVAAPGQLPGTVNLHMNPGAEDGLTGWAGYGGATLSEEQITVWEGGRAVRVAPAGSTAGQGVTIQSVAGTDLTAVERMMWSSIYAEGAGQVIQARSVAHYLDGSTQAGDFEVVGTLTPYPAWQRLVAPALVLDPLKKLLNLEATFATQVANASAWTADGAQIEEEHGTGVSPWTSGAYGFATGTWFGAPNRAVSYRLPITMQTSSLGYGGQIEVEAKLFKMTYDNKIVEEITDIVIQGSLSSDPDRDVTWAFDATVTAEGYRRLRPSKDWIAPFVTVRYPDGKIKHGQLGLYFVAPSVQTYDEHASSVKLSAYDPLWLLSRQNFQENITITASEDRSRSITRILDLAVLLGGSDNDPSTPKRYYIPSGGGKGEDDIELTVDDDLLQAANDLAESGLLFQLWSSATGFITTRVRGEDGKRIRDRQPVRTWAANVPDEYVYQEVPAWYWPERNRSREAYEIISPDAKGPSWYQYFEIDPQSGRPIPYTAKLKPWVPVVDIVNPGIFKLDHEVIGKVPTTPKEFDLYDEVIITSPKPRRPYAPFNEGWHKGWFRKRREHPRKVDDEFGRHRSLKMVCPYPIDDATGQQLALALADELSVKSEFVTLDVVIDPSIELVRETVATAVFDLAGNPVAVGHWWVGRVTYNLWPSVPKMSMELSRVRHGADDVDVDVERRG